MDYSDFLLCIPPPPDRRLYDLAKEYHDTCEAFDLTVCTGPVVKGEVQPVNRHELGLINRHAVEVRKRIIEKGESMGLSEKEIRKAFGRYDAVFCALASQDASGS